MDDPTVNVHKSSSEYGDAGVPEDAQYSIYKSLSRICVIFAIIATGTVIAGYFQVRLTRGIISEVRIE